MSDAAQISSTARSRRPMHTGSRLYRLTPLEALECGFALFKSTFALEAWRYYAGAAPLVICFIPMWVTDGQVSLSEGVLLLEAVLLAGAYLLRIWMVTEYMRGVRERAFGFRAARFERPFIRAGLLGRLLTLKIILSAATVVMLPSFVGAPWFYGACQFACLESEEDSSERRSLGGCLKLAGRWYGQSLLLFLMLVPLWIAAWLNGLLVAMILPALLHSVFGLNTFLSTETGVEALVRSSAFWLSLCSGVWLTLDPIVKCTFVVVYQHLRSRQEGDDLRGLLAGLPRERQKKAEMIASAGAARNAMAGTLVLVAILCSVQTPGAGAAQLSATQSSLERTADSTSNVRVHTLRQALDKESQRAIYRWHEAEHPSPPIWFDKALSKLGDAVSQGWNSLASFFRELWPKWLTPTLGTEKNGSWRLKDLRLWVGLLAALTIAAGGLLFWLRRHRETACLAIPVTTAPLPDLSNTAIASERSEDEWFVLAERLQVEGELRMALRAAYLGLLAGLARREFLTIRPDRTNREYLDEFSRRWRRRPHAAVEVRGEVPEKLRSSLRLFDRVWYGSQVLTSAMVAIYCQDQRELLHHV